MSARNAARTFYTEAVGLKVSLHSPPGAVVFDTSPIPFAVRTPVTDLKNKDALGEGIALWFDCDDADALHDHLIKNGHRIVFPPKDGPFGRYFAFDSFGYTITPHTVARASETGDTIPIGIRRSYGMTLRQDHEAQ